MSEAFCNHDGPLFGGTCECGTRIVTVEGVRFYPDTFHGAWYEAGTYDEIGALYLPMLSSGEPDLLTVPGEIEVKYEDA